MVWFLFLLVLFAGSPAFAASWYMAPGASDGNPCTEGAPCGSFTKARTVMSSGDTLYLRGGSYCENITKDNMVPNGTSNTNRTTITSYPGEQAAITCPGWGFNLFTVTTPIQWITIDRINLENGATYAPGGCPVTGLRFQNSEISGNPDSSGVFGGPAGPGCQPDQLEYINLHVHNNGSSYLDHGMYICGTNTIIRDSHIHHNSGYNIQFFSSTHPECGSGSKIYNNVLHDAQIFGGIVVGNGDSIQVYNNVIYNNASEGIGYVYGVKTNGKIYNNTIYGSGGSAINLGNPSNEENHVIGLQVKNNILFGNGTNVVTETRVDSVTYENNLCPSLLNGCTETGNPAFTDAGNAIFTIEPGSAAQNSGSDLSSTFITDILGAQRGQGGAWDIGAYEIDEGGSPPPTGNPIYVAASGGTATTDCIAAESEATPIRTIAGGLACMNTIPGKIMYIKAGTYAECIETLTQPIRGGNGPSFSDATMIASHSTDAVIIKPTSCGNGVAFFLNNGSADSYILFRGSSTNRLVFDGTNVGNNFAMYPGANHIRFEFVEFKNSASFEGLYGLNTSNIEVVDSLVHGAVTSGIAFDGTSANWLVERTEVYSNGGAGINHKSGTATSVTIKESTVKNNTGNGITIGAVTGTTLTNSLVYDNGGIGIRIQTGSSTTKIYNNTFYSNTGNGIQCDSGAATAEVRNTISFGNALSGDIVNNCTLTLQTNLTDNPLFVDPPNNLQLQEESTAINNGTTLAGVLIDRAGTPRPVGSSYDIGAYDRDATPTTPPPGPTGHPPRLALMMF